MFYILLYILLVVIATEAITELIVKSELFEPLRKMLFKSKYKFFNFIHKIVDCGYCFSVWASMLIVFLFYVVDTRITNFILVVIVVHRLSNLFHYIVDRLNSNKV